MNANENVYYNRIEELETALESLLECFDRTGKGRPWIEVEVQSNELADPVDTTYITDGQVNKFTANAIEFAEQTLYDEELIVDAEDEN